MESDRPVHHLLPQFLDPGVAERSARLGQIFYSREMICDGLEVGSDSSVAFGHGIRGFRALASGFTAITPIEGWDHDTSGSRARSQRTRLGEREGERGWVFV